MRTKKKDGKKIERRITAGLSGQGKGRGGEITLRHAEVKGYSDGGVSVHFFSKRRCDGGAAFAFMNPNEALGLARALLYASGLPHTVMLSKSQNKNGDIVVECHSSDGVVRKEGFDGTIIT